jgi:hypothetical protein
MRRARGFAARSIRAVTIVIADDRIPRWLRWGSALGLLPVPGPFDEGLLLVIGGILWLFYRERLRIAWRQADAVPVRRRRGDRLPTRGNSCLRRLPFRLPLRSRRPAGPGSTFTG